MPIPSIKRGNEEELLQRGIVSLLDLHCDPKVLWTAINPGGDKKSAATAARHKAMGLRAGMPDLVFVLRDGYAAFMELKSSKGKLSPAQAEFQRTCIISGVPFTVVQSMDQAIAVLNGWRVFKTKVQP